MDYFRNVAVFRRTVELGSISAAGRDMRLSAGRALLSIVQLEQSLGARLLNRSTRRLIPTEHGHVFYRESSKIAQLLYQAEQSVTSRFGTVHRSLRISSPSQFSRYVFGPLIPEFHDLHPEIEIQLSSRSTKIDYSDVILSFSTSVEQGYVASKSFEIQKVLVASSEYVERNGLPRSMSSLLSSRHRCLMFEDCEQERVGWQFTHGRQIVSLHPKACLRSNDEEVITGWVLGGVGIAQKPIFEVIPHLKERRLHVVLGCTPPAPAKLGVKYLERYRNDPQVKELLKLIIERMHEATASPVPH